MENTVGKKVFSAFELRLLGLLNDPVVIFDPDRRIIFWNKAAEETYGFKAEEAMGQALKDILRTEFPSIGHDEIQKQLKEKGFCKGEVIHHDKKGKPVFIEFSSIRLKTKDTGSAEYFTLSIQKDVTKQKLIENSVKASEENLQRHVKELEDTKKALINVLDDLEFEKTKLEEAKAKDEALLASIGDGLVAVDRDGEVIVMNNAAQHLTGYKISEVLGKPLYKVMDIEDKDGSRVPYEKRPIYMALTRSIKTTTTTTTTTTTSYYYYVRPNGSRLPVSITCTPIVFEGRIIGALELFRDISKDLADDRAKSEFISIASHQLRTPLSVMSWSVERLVDYQKAFDPGSRLFFDKIVSATGRMVVLVNDLLNVSRLELGTYTIRKEQFDFIELVRNILKDFEQQIQDKKINFTQNYTANLNSIILDKGSVELIIHNLLSNAVKFSAPKGKIVLNIELKKGTLSISVCDSGWGIPKKDYDGVFKKMYRADNIKSKVEGTGLGLYIVKSVVGHLKGEISFTSEVKKGTCFYVKLPVD